MSALDCDGLSDHHGAPLSVDVIGFGSIRGCARHCDRAYAEPVVRQYMERMASSRKSPSPLASRPVIDPDTGIVYASHPDGRFTRPAMGGETGIVTVGKGSPIEARLLGVSE